MIHHYQHKCNYDQRLDVDADVEVDVDHDDAHLLSASSSRRSVSSSSSRNQSFSSCYNIMTIVLMVVMDGGENLQMYETSVLLYKNSAAMCCFSNLYVINI